MLPSGCSDELLKDDGMFSGQAAIVAPPYNPQTYYKDIATHPYFKALVVLRHHIKRATDDYMSQVVQAKNVDLFMMTPSVSSPMGPGSDSEAIPIQFGTLKTYLVDSSQFGFEPLLLSGLKKVYCYLPSLRGEDPDARHLNQFFHAEAEISGGLDELLPLIEGYVQHLSKTLLCLPSMCGALSSDSKASTAALTRIAESASFPRITFDDAALLLANLPNVSELIVSSSFGRTITTKGELALLKEMQTELPVWITGFDRDTVAFYQKPNPENTNKTINADLIFPSISVNSFGGEIVGCGQRQDAPEEMYESLKRQGINAEPYEWYIDLRRQPGYGTSSGFGLGIERFIAWALAKENIRDVALYPRLKNIISYP